MQSDMTRLKHETLLNFHRRELRILEANAPSCKTCEHSLRGGAFCEKWKAEPPAETQAAGCPEWLGQEVPF